MKTKTIGSFKKALALLTIAAAAISVSGCGKARSIYTTESVRLTPEERSWICPEEKYADIIALYRKDNFKGTALVATDDDLLFLYCENALEKDGATPVSQNTVFDIASMSKTITAVAVLQLAEKGSLSLDDTLDKYFPDYEAGKEITIYNLLHMRSGIPDYLNNAENFWDTDLELGQLMRDLVSDKISDEELLTSLYQAPLLFKPGSGFSYCNTNYRLLALIIEQVSGMKYCDYLQANIFDVCGMTHTTSMAVGDLTYVPVNFEAMYKAGITDENGYPMDPNNSRGDGGIHSCISDILAFDRALFGGQLLNEASMEIMLHDDNNYCCGLYSIPGYNHGGNGYTTKTMNTIVPSEDYGHIYVIWMSHL